ncbi:MAG: hypothetical protein EAZ74_04075 [Alphaproteobacteria bacterium]|nr:MAG: hypothetical protein EAY76_04070 [Alphaproteobacteria bacterium]TAF14414.1 MAG: hypothetical protein EAZ74_04075 [Alphaproteobacteria bacterium]TAF39575.1 MAG: hypothetical protein EAZ66_04625 [Alphaproteobacteria bacterium]TAF77558.1 MAG: hypothetical protein EAZ52_00205 [Alphaproteobacteria bacterium]
MIIETIVGVLAGGLGSWVSKIIGLYEKKQDYEHELKLHELQMRVRQHETERELAIAETHAYSAMRAASYSHDSATSTTSQWVNNVLRLVRPLLTLLLILLVWAIWITLADENTHIRTQIVEGVLFMASAAFAWWFGDRAPAIKKLS